VFQPQFKVCQGEYHGLESNNHGLICTGIQPLIRGRAKSDHVCICSYLQLHKTVFSDESISSPLNSEWVASIIITTD
jgi:hypothetical protein